MVLFHENEKIMYEIDTCKDNVRCPQFEKEVKPAGVATAGDGRGLDGPVSVEGWAGLGGAGIDG